MFRGYRVLRKLPKEFFYPLVSNKFWNSKKLTLKSQISQSSSPSSFAQDKFYILLNIDRLVPDPHFPHQP